MDKSKLENQPDTIQRVLISRRQFIRDAGILGGAVAGALLLASSCKNTITITSSVSETRTVSSTTPPATVRLPPVNGLEYLVNSDPSKVDNSRLPVTPLELLHTLNPSPQVDIAGYRLNVHGQTSGTLSLAYSDLQQFPITEETSLLVCPTVFADNETLRGFKLSSLMNAAGVKPGATQLIFRSLDNLQQNLAIGDAIGEDVMLALEVDGQILPREHGYPIRLIRPGQMGVFWLKCINDIEVV